MGILPLKEEVILSGLLMLGGSSRGALIRKKVVELTRKEIVYGTLYNLMEGLKRKGFVTTTKSQPTNERGGRSKTIYTITDAGRANLHETLALHSQIMSRLNDTEQGVIHG